MSLTAAKAPFGPDREGHFDFDAPDRAVYVERFPRRVRAVLGGRTVVDSEAVMMIHETGSLPSYAFPRGDVQIDAADVRHLQGYVSVAWQAVDAWFEEDERVEVHPRDPYHRVDSFSTSRRITVSVDGVELATSTRAIALYETSLPVRYYLPRADVRLDRLERSGTLTECPYKGTARHWSVRIGDETVDDAAWQYVDGVRREAERVRGLFAFDSERVEIAVDATRQDS